MSEIIQLHDEAFDGGPQRGEVSIRYTFLSTKLHDDWLHFGSVDVAYTGEEVMFNVVIKTTVNPA